MRPSAAGQTVRKALSRTGIVIAHRLTTIERVDRALVLHQGKIVEQGSHDELLRADGLYTRLRRLQYVQQSPAQ